MPLNLGKGPRENRLTKQQKAECEAAVYGLKATITTDDIDFAERLLARETTQQEQYVTSSRNHSSGR